MMHNHTKKFLRLKLSKGRMIMKKKNLMKAFLCTAICAGMVILSACGGSSDAGDSETSAEASAEDEGYADSINILVYPDYVSEDVLAAFEDEFGIAVNITYLSYEEDNITRIESGDDFDIINPNQETVHQMLQEELLQPINKDNIPNLANLYEEFNTYEYPGEEDYSIPYMCGSMSIIVNKDTCPIEITEWDDLADPALAGEIVSTDIDRRFVATTLAEHGFDPNTTNQEDLDEVFDWLCAFNDNVKVYDNGAPRTSLENGDCSVAFTYTTDYVLVKQEDPDGNYELVTLPNGWYSRGEWMLAIPASSTKVEEAELLINYIHDAKNYADNVMKYPGIPVNEASNEYLTDEYKELFKAFEIPETANFFTLAPMDSEAIEMYDLFISNVMAN